jgi:hypothetical protein
VSIWALRFSSDGHSPPGATFSDRRLHTFHDGADETAADAGQTNQTTT